MITDQINPPELLVIPEIANVSIATGTRIVHISGQPSTPQAKWLAAPTWTSPERFGET
jgi:hypothetical protein